MEEPWSPLTAADASSGVDEVGQLLGVGVTAQLVGHPVGLVAQLLHAAVLHERAVPQRFGELGRHHGQPEVGVGVPERALHVVGVQAGPRLGDPLAGRPAVAQGGGGDRSPAAVPAAVQRHLVEGGRALARTDLAGVAGVVAEVLVRDGPVLEAEQPVGEHLVPVELDLDLGVPGHGGQEAGEVLHEDAPCLGGRVDVVVGAVGLVGQLLHELVVERAEAHADGGQPDVAALADLLEDVVGTGGAHIGDPVRQQQHQHGPAPVGLPQRHVVAPHETGLGVGAPARLDPVADLVHDPAGVARHLGRIEDRGGPVVVGHHADPGACRQSRQEQLDGLVDQAHPLHGPVGGPCGLAHRPGPVQHQHHGVRYHQIRQQLGRLHAHPQHHPVGVAERGGSRLQGDVELVDEGPVTAVEVVDELLHPHGPDRRQLAALQVVAGNDVGRGVHIEGEGGQVVVVRVHERVDAVVLERVGPALGAAPALLLGTLPVGPGRLPPGHAAGGRIGR